MQLVWIFWSCGNILDIRQDDSGSVPGISEVLSLSCCILKKACILSLFTGLSLRYDFDEMVGTVPLTLHIISSDDLALWEVQVDKVASEDKT